MKKFLVFLSFFLSVHFALAWKARGHMIVAAISWDNLNPALQEKVTEILLMHPDYKRKWRKEYKKYKNDLVLGKFLMMQASTWPDDIRSYKHPMYKFHKGEWHYINYKIKFPDCHDTSIPSDDENKGNIVFAIDHSRNMVFDNHTPEDQRAMYFSWLIHLLGDIHQPLHCGSLFNDDFENGDSGGNKFYIKPNTAGIKLHSYWDGLLGTSNNFRTASNRGIQIAKKNQKKNVLPSVCTNTASGNENSREWSLNAFEQAIVYAYLDGQLKYGTSKEMATKIPLDYGKKSKKIAEKNAAIAGYRLSNTLEMIIEVK